MAKGTAAKKVKRSTAAGKEMRVAKVFAMLLEGKQRSDIFRFNSENWKVTERQCENYIADAQKIVSENNQNERTYLISVHKNRLLSLYQIAHKNKEYKECREILKEIAKIEGHYAPTKVAQTNSDGDDVLSFLLPAGLEQTPIKPKRPTTRKPRTKSAAKK